MKLMSKEALWITSGASAMNSRKSSTTSAKNGLSERNSAGKAMHGKGFRRHVAFRIDVAVKGLAGRHAVEHLDAADFDQPVAAQGIKAGGFGIENDFAHDDQKTAGKRRIRSAAAAS